MSRRDCPCGGSVTCNGDCTLPDPVRCDHCHDIVDESACFEGHGFILCSTFCAYALLAANHGEDCQCGDALEAWAIPEMRCCYCQRRTEGEAAHAGCREKVRRALAFQAGALAGRGAA